MTPEHKPFPIADYNAGIMLPREPWISPRNAFRDIKDGRVYRGRLEKRTGFERLGELCQDSVDQSVTSHNAVLGTGDIIVAYYRSPAPGVRPIPETVTFRSDNGTPGAPYINAELDLGSGQWIAAGTTDHPDLGNVNRDMYHWTIVETGTSTIIGWMSWDPDEPIFNQLSLAAIRWELHSGYIARATDDGEMFYRRNPMSEVVGLYSFSTATGDFSIAADPDYLYVYNAGVGYYEVQGGVTFDSPQSFSGGDDDYFWFWPMEDFVMLTNGIDPVCQWDPSAPAATSITEQATDFDTADGLGSNDINAALLVIRFKSRVVYLNTNEGGTVYPRRARFTAAGSYTFFDSDLDFLDAPTELGDIVTAEFIGARCFVGFEKGWMELVSTGDGNQPFEWEPFISRFGAVSKLSTIKDNARLLSRSDTTMQALDPNGQYYMDEAIPDLVKDFSADKTELSFGVRNEDQRAFWWTYVAADADIPEKVLCATYDEKNNVAWSRYDLRFNVFSEFDSRQTPTWNSLGPTLWNNILPSWNDARIGTVGFTQTIGGGSNGTVYVFSQVLEDEYINGPQTISMEFETQKLSPYPGASAHLGWIDVYADVATQGALILEFYVDSRSTPHTVKTFDFTPQGSADKGIRRARINHSGQFHRIKGYSTDGRPLAIDALIPWFRPSGRMREIN